MGAEPRLLRAVPGPARAAGRRGAELSESHSGIRPDDLTSQPKTWPVLYTPERQAADIGDRDALLRRTVERISALEAEVAELRGALEPASGVQAFKLAWDRGRALAQDDHVDLAPGWQASVHEWLSLGVPLEVLEGFVDLAMHTPLRGRRSDQTTRFAYLAGCCWRWLEQYEGSRANEGSS